MTTLFDTEICRISKSSDSWVEYFSENDFKNKIEGFMIGEQSELLTFHRV